MLSRNARNQRSTRQRLAIRRSFERAQRPLSPPQVLKAARAEASGLGIATVYRTIKALLKQGWLVSVDLPGMGTVYEPAGKPHHHHFHCEQCSRVFELSGCIPKIERLANSGFSVRRHELIFYGLCNDCRT